MTSVSWPIEALEERGVTDADYDALWQLHVDSMRSYVTATYGWVDDVQVSMFREAWPRKRDQRVLVDRGAIVAAWLFDYRADHVYLALVEVASSHQRRGLGAAIVRRLLSAASAARLPARLAVMKANPGAQRLYERHGFVVERETATHWWMIAR